MSCVDRDLLLFIVLQLVNGALFKFDLKESVTVVGACQPLCQMANNTAVLIPGWAITVTQRLCVDLNTHNASYYYPLIVSSIISRDTCFTHILHEEVTRCHSLIICKHALLSLLGHLLSFNFFFI